MDKVVWQQEHQLWDIDIVKSVIADHSNAISFFCGGSRNFPRFMDLLDGVFVLDVDLDTLKRRLASRPEDEFGGRPVEQEMVVRLHATKEDIPKVMSSSTPLRRLNASWMRFWKSATRSRTPGILARLSEMTATKVMGGRAAKFKLTHYQRIHCFSKLRPFRGKLNTRSLPPNGGTSAPSIGWKLPKGENGFHPDAQLPSVNVKAFGPWEGSR